MIDEIKNVGCIPMSTPFDEASVDLCVEFDLPIIKIASSDMNDWVLIEKIALTRRPVIASTGGASEKDLDDLVRFFERRDIPLAINHCVSLYPSEDDELQLDQIDYLRARYPDHDRCKLRRCFRLRRDAGGLCAQIGRASCRERV